MKQDDTWPFRYHNNKELLTMGDYAWGHSVFLHLTACEMHALSTRRAAAHLTCSLDNLVVDVGDVHRLVRSHVEEVVQNTANDVKLYVTAEHKAKVEHRPETHKKTLQTHTYQKQGEFWRQ